MKRSRREKKRCSEKNEPSKLSVRPSEDTPGVAAPAPAPAPGSAGAAAAALSLSPEVAGGAGAAAGAGVSPPDVATCGPGDLDLTVYGLRRFCQLALKGSPTVLLPLFLEDEHVIVRTEVGEELQMLAPAFVSQTAARAFLGYLTAQRDALTGTRHPARSRELSGEHGYDTKYAMHALRIGLQGIELLTTGVITLPVPEPERSLLRAVRAGRLPLADVLTEIDRVARHLVEASEHRRLSTSPDVDAVDRFVVRAYRRAWDAGRHAP